MKTILHIIDTTGPGGAETVFIDLISHLPAEKYRSVVVIRGKGWVYEELDRRGIKPIILDAKGSFNWRYLKNLVNLIRAEKVDLVQSHLLGSNIYASLAGLLSRTPVVATFHGMVDVAEKERLLFLKFAAINYGAAAIVAVSKDLRDNIINRTSLRSDKSEVIYNGINTEDFQRPKSNRIRQQFGWGEDEIIIGSLGNIRPAKAYDVLLQAASLLKESAQKKEKGQSYRFVIAGHGKGSLYQKIMDLRSELKLEEHVQFLGFNEAPAEFLSNLDIFVLSSSSEGFSIATIQAMATGLPVIATRSGGPQEIITHEKNGSLVDVGVPQQITDAIEKLIEAPEQRQQLAESGRNHAIKTFDIKNMINNYETIYQKLL